MQVIHANGSRKHQTEQNKSAMRLSDPLALGIKDFIAVIATEFRAQNENVGFCESEED